MATNGNNSSRENFFFIAQTIWNFFVSLFLSIWNVMNWTCPIEIDTKQYNTIAREIPINDTIIALQSRRPLAVHS